MMSPSSVTLGSPSSCDTMGNTKDSSTNGDDDDDDANRGRSFIRLPFVAGNSVRSGPEGTGGNRGRPGRAAEPNPPGGTDSGGLCTLRDAPPGGGPPPVLDSPRVANGGRGIGFGFGIQRQHQQQHHPCGGGLKGTTTTTTTTILPIRKTSNNRHARGPPNRRNNPTSRNRNRRIIRNTNTNTNCSNGYGAARNMRFPPHRCTREPSLR
mmetsp:Transcript_18047/g.50137  ORF Transcript_18047/g.50137 Transcript_18047/m.50137 type:complete len:209 (-) Transcript_18047:533-1159(-)